jgi:hypothetical protein
VFSDIQVLNASTSTDSNVPLGLPSGLSFAWSCSVNGIPCRYPNGTALVLGTSDAALIPAGFLEFDQTYFIRLQVSKEVRSAAISVFVIASRASYTVSIRSPTIRAFLKDGTSKTVRGERLVLRATASIVDPDIEFRWSVLQGSLNLSDPLSVFINSNDSSDTLVVFQNVLLPGAMCVVLCASFDSC